MADPLRKPPPRQGTGKFVITRNGQPDLEFKTSAEAIDYLVSHEGYMNLYNQYGEHQLTKGNPE